MATLSESNWRPLHQKSWNQGKIPDLSGTKNYIPTKKYLHVLLSHCFTKAELEGIKYAQLPKSLMCVISKEINSRTEAHKNPKKFVEIRHNSPQYFNWRDIVVKLAWIQSFPLTQIDLKKLILNIHLYFVLILRWCCMVTRW